MHSLTLARLAYFSCLGPTFPIKVLRVGWECQRVCVARVNDYFRYLIGWFHVSLLIYYATTVQLVNQTVISSKDFQIISELAVMILRGRMGVSHAL